MAVKFGEGDHLPFRWSRLPVVRHRRDPLRPRRGNTGVQESLLLKLQQPALRHRRRAPVIGGDESHRHLEEEGRRLRYFVLEGVRACGDGKGGKGKSDGGRQKELWLEDPTIFIDG